MSVHVSDGRSLDLFAIEENIHEPADYQCSECIYHTRFKQNLTRHETLHQTISAPKSSTPVKPNAAESSSKSSG